MSGSSGPYEGLRQKHLALRQQNNYLFISLLIPVGLYMISQRAVFMLAAVLWLATVSRIAKRRQEKLLALYPPMEAETVQQIRDALREYGFPDTVLSHSTFGYRKDSAGFRPVLLFCSGGKLYWMENILRKNCLYTIQDKMLYLLDADRQALSQPPRMLSPLPADWQTAEEKHLALLQAESARLGQFLVVESFIYAVIWEKMKAGARKELFHSNYEVSLLKKEPLYCLCSPAESDAVFYLPERFRLILQSPEE